MAEGPILIFDKSTLESLDKDEAVWLDNFYVSNVTPLFFVECLGDLEKEIRNKNTKGTTEQLVVSLADRTPQMKVHANVYHRTLLMSELSGQFNAGGAFGRPVLGGGERVMLSDLKGMIFRNSPEEEALTRWMKREFLEIERDMAKSWRKAISQVDFSAKSATFQKFFRRWKKPNTLTEAKNLTGQILDQMDPDWLIGFGLALLEMSEVEECFRDRWIKSGRPSLPEFIPYFMFVLSIDVFFYLSLAAQLLNRVKPSHQVDLAYLYYLPFCMVFSSRDHFHVDVAPLFMRPDQTFIHGDALKQDLKKIDDFYSLLPEEIRDQGIMSFAKCPPEDVGFLTTRLWDKYLPNWRNQSEATPNISKEDQETLVKMANRFIKESIVGGHNEDDIDQLGQVTIQRTIRTRRGKWKLVPPEAERQSLNNC